MATKDIQKTKYHVVLNTRDGCPVLKGELRKALDIILDEASKKEFDRYRVAEYSIFQNQVYLLLEVPSEYTLSSAVNPLKDAIYDTIREVYTDLTYMWGQGYHLLSPEEVKELSRMRERWLRDSEETGPIVHAA